MSLVGSILDEAGTRTPPCEGAEVKSARGVDAMGGGQEEGSQVLRCVSPLPPGSMTAASVYALLNPRCWSSDHEQPAAARNTN